MSKATPFLGETANRDEGLFGIASIDLTVTQDRHGLHGGPVQHHYTKSTMPRIERCANEKCRNGGLDLQKHVLFWPDGVSEFACPGVEDQYSCGNRFKVEMRVIRD